MKALSYGDICIRRLFRVLNYLAKPIDQAFRPKVIIERPPLFILGAPRSGTTLTYQVFTQAFDVAYMTVLMGYVYGLVNIQYRALKPILMRPKPVFSSLHGHTRGFLAPSEHPGFWRQWFDFAGNIQEQMEADSDCYDKYASMRLALMSVSTIMRKPLVIKCLYLNVLSGVLAEALPDSRFLVVTREPILTIQSIIVARQQRNGTKSWWSSTFPGYEALLSEPLWKQATAQTFFIQKYISELLKRHAKDRFKTINYVQLCTDPYRVLESLREWLEPLGYHLYEQCRIPERFSPSCEVKLNKQTIDKIDAYWADLDEKYSARSDLDSRDR